MGHRGDFGQMSSLPHLGSEQTVVFGGDIPSWNESLFEILLGS